MQSKADHINIHIYAFENLLVLVKFTDFGKLYADMKMIDNTEKTCRSYLLMDYLSIRY